MSDQDTTIFNKDTNVAPATADTTVTTDPSNTVQIPDSVSEMIGEGRKYKTVEDALNSIPHAQTHIEKLETENEDFRTKVAAATTLDSVLEKIDSTPKTEPNQTSTSVDDTNLDARIMQALDAKDLAATRKANQAAVTSTLIELYGDKAEEAYVEIATDSGLSVEALNTLAATSPQAVLKLANNAKVTIPPAKPTSSVNTESFSLNAKQEESARLPRNATTSDTTNAWRAAGAKVQRR